MIKMLHYVCLKYYNNVGLHQCPKVAELVTSEFFEQGDRERSELKVTPAVSTQALKTLTFHGIFFF